MMSYPPRNPINTWYARFQHVQFQENPFNYLDGAPKIRPPLDITDTDTDDETSAVEEEAVPSLQVPLSESQSITTAPGEILPQDDLC